MSTPNIEVTIQHDRSVERVIERTQKKLLRKYNRRKDVDEKWLKNSQSGTSKAISIILTAVTAVVMVFAVIFCIGTIYSAYNGTPPMFFSHSTMKIASGSMSAPTITIEGEEYESGFEIGDTIVIRSVDTKTLKVGDKIAFYAYAKNYAKYHQIGKEEITVDPNTKTKYKTSFLQLLGFQTKELTEAAKNNGMLTFHHITNVYRDTNGKLWFKTQGSANAVKDVWYVSEEMVVGIYSKSVLGNFVARIVELIATDWGFILLLLVPIGLLTLILIRSFAIDLQLALLELDVVEEKRKLTDALCVKNKIGYRMDNKTKYKVLAQAEEDEKLQYILLLWPKSLNSNAIKKYVIRKKYLLEPNKKLLLLNRECEKMYQDGKQIKEIAVYYAKQKEMIEKKQKEVEKRMKHMHEALEKRK